MADSINDILLRSQKSHDLEGFHSIIQSFDRGANIETIFERLDEYLDLYIKYDIHMSMYADNNESIAVFLGALAEDVSLFKTLAKEMNKTAKSHPELKSVISEYYGEIAEISRILEERLKFILNQMTKK